jgi:hypothetical protein
MGKRDIPHRTTVSNEIVAKSMKVKGLIVEQLKNSDSQISFTFDAGTSRASDPYLTVTGHWIDNDWNLHEQILAFTEIIGSHTGVNTGEILIQTFKDYQIFDPDKVCNQPGIFYCKCNEVLTSLDGVLLIMLLYVMRPSHMSPRPSIQMARSGL